LPHTIKSHATAVNNSLTT